ncbi:Protein crumbs [Amphibalanus amphitrite]|uniref:Protein crumbs n=1 Tax=Amphibalanus amphitrite TaxID=1232801 RepID=A0A6A4VSE4_AMPAM|nr:Protein crumbs [Amphibalanus amphitrite]
MLSCNMISRLWIVMTIAINSAYIVSGEPRRYPRRLSRSCEARNVDNPCQNGGRCHVTVSAGDAAEPALVTCRCTPAWTGVTCELERDPCTDGSAVCGPGWSCVRNSSNTAAGYDCGCGVRSGWQRLADGLPRCVDIDECALLAPACFNGGQCRNRAGSYECLCRPVDGQRGILRVGQNVSSAAEALTDSSLEEALRRPAAAVRALVGPVVGRARAALLRLRLTEAARAERQEAALAAAEAAERQLRQIQEEVSRRAGKRRAAERRLWQLLDATESVARRGAETQRAARQQLARQEAAQARLDAERRRRRQLRQNEAAAAANHAAARASLLRRIQSARQQAVAQSRALTEARRQADNAEEKARKAAEVLRLERLELRRLEQTERQKLLDLQRHGVERLKAAVREAEHEERRAQEAEDERQRAEHQARPEPEPPSVPPLPPVYRDVKTGVRVRV